MFVNMGTMSATLSELNRDAGFEPPGFDSKATMLGLGIVAANVPLHVLAYRIGRLFG